MVGAMIYTLGRFDTYERGFAVSAQREIPFHKLGRTATYVGGSVWETYEQAEWYILQHQLDEHRVYGVDCDWDDEWVSKDTQRCGRPCQCEFHALLKDAPLVRVL